jgi:hypothetical protein
MNIKNIKYRIQIYISEPFWTKLCTHLPLGLEEIVGVCMDLQYLTSSTFSTSSVGSECRILGRRWLQAQESSESWRVLFLCFSFFVCVILGRRWLPAQVIRDSAISVIAARVTVTSRILRCSGTVAPSYWRCLALWVMHWKCGEVNGMRVCKNGLIVNN